MTTDELNQLRDLLETLESGDVESAIIWLRAAIKGEEKRQNSRKSKGSGNGRKGE